MANALERASRAALELLFPAQCALCGHGGTLLCGLCVSGLQSADGSRCSRCWSPVSGERSVCHFCNESPPSYASLRSGFVLQDDARRLVHLFKYDGLTSLAAPMANLLCGAVEIPPVDILVPVPLHRGRENSRGYNQAAVLAREVAKRVSLRLDVRAARRIRPTEPLVQTKSREERLAIVSDAFRASPERVVGRRVLLLDDVATTGATLDSCAKAILSAGATSVYGLTWARAH